MRPSDLSVPAALDAAESLIRTTAAAAVVQASDSLLLNMRTAGPSRQRGQLAFAQLQILQSQKLFLTTFATALHDAVQPSASHDGRLRGRRAAPPRRQQDIPFDRIGQLIASNCETELRELAGYTSALLGHDTVEPERNPLRGEQLGGALRVAMDAAIHEPETQVIFARELGRSMALAMPACYRAIAAELHRLGVRPLRPPEPDPADPQTPMDLLENLLRGAAGQQPRADDELGPAARQADAAMLDLMQRLNAGDPDAADASLDEAERPPERAAAPLPGDAPARTPTAASPPVRPALQNYEAQPPASHPSDLKAPNLIRAHRDALMQASRGKLDHLVIEVVSSLFDQVLSDERIPPQLARQIARLQLPVLRVALKDPSFFSSSRHPVRAFINRVASLACAFDDFETGPSRELMARIGALVKSIAEGDFDQLALYDAKLLELERFSAEQNEAEMRRSAAAATLRAKELEWRIQQHFGRLLHAALDGLGLPEFVHAFLAGPWAQAIATASRLDGAESARPLQLRQGMAVLVRSLQPKRTPGERSRFIAGLPGLMASLTAGMNLAAWPQPTRQAFFDQLMAVHAGSLKVAAPTDAPGPAWDSQLAIAIATPLPSADDAAAELPRQDGQPAAPELQYSEAEGRAIGLLPESAVDWSSQPEPGSRRAALVPAVAGVSLIGASDATMAPAGPEGMASTVEPTGDVRDSLQLGMAYQFKLKEQWEKVRLTYMSQSRSLFLFTHGANDRETISMTTRMLTRLCDTGRMRAYENAFLMDRATQRARQQLAGLGPSAVVPAAVVLGAADGPAAPAPTTAAAQAR